MSIVKQCDRCKVMDAGIGERITTPEGSMPELCDKCIASFWEWFRWGTDTQERIIAEETVVLIDIPGPADFAKLTEQYNDAIDAQAAPKSVSITDCGCPRCRTRRETDERGAIIGLLGEGVRRLSALIEKEIGKD